MAISNKQNRLVLATGNKSEMAMGYCTLYGDMNGAISVLADVPKTTVYKLAEYINKDKDKNDNDSGSIKINNKKIKKNKIKKNK